MFILAAVYTVKSHSKVGLIVFYPKVILVSVFRSMMNYLRKTIYIIILLYSKRTERILRNSDIWQLDLMSTESELHYENLKI